MDMLPWFDNRTLVACNLLISTGFAFVFYGMKRVYPSLRGVHSVAASFLLGVPGTFLLVAADPSSHVSSILIAHLLLFGSSLLLYRGVMSFLGSSRAMGSLVGIAAAALGLLFYFTEIQDKIVARMVVLSLTMGVIRGLAAWELLRKSSTCRSPEAIRLFAASIVFFATVDLNCSVIMMSNGGFSSYLQSDAVTSVALLFSLISVSVIGLFGLVLYSTELIASSKDESEKDTLSGVFNRRGIEAQLAAELKNIGRGNHKLSIALIDIDHFKSINDIKGHAAGDAALRDMVNAVSTRLRGRDSLGRYGGDEFLLILPQTAASMALLVAQRMAEAVEEVGLTGRRQRLTLSIGLTEAVADDDAVTLVARADKALYQAKSDGRNCLRLIRATDRNRADEDMPKRLPERNALVSTG